MGAGEEEVDEAAAMSTSEEGGSRGAASEGGGGGGGVGEGAEAKGEKGEGKTTHPAPTTQFEPTAT